MRLALLLILCACAGTSEPATTRYTTPTGHSMRVATWAVEGVAPVRLRAMPWETMRQFGDRYGYAVQRRKNMENL